MKKLFAIILSAMLLLSAATAFADAYRIAIAQPKLLLLDEHTAALDPGAAEKVMKLTETIVQRDHITTLMVTHDMDYALRVGSRTTMLDSGRIVMDLTGEERARMTSGALAELLYAKGKH